MSVDEWEGASWLDLMECCSKTQEYLLNSVLNLKYSIERSRNHSLIRSMSARLKTMDSLQAKLRRLDLDCSASSAARNLHDIVGIRLICSYMDDITSVIEQLSTIENYKIIQIKDYVRNPKPSGYRSVHVIGLCTISGKPIQCEIQLRTTAMDSWAALEHQMRYKKDLPDSEFVNRELLECSSLLYETDCRMQAIHSYLHDQRIERNAASDQKQHAED